MTLSAWSMFCFSLENDLLQNITSPSAVCLASLSFGLSAYWLHTYLSVRSPKRIDADARLNDWFSYWLKIMVLSYLICMMIPLICLLSIDLGRRYSQHIYTREHLTLLEPQSGFRQLQGFAMQHYGLYLHLADTEHGWALNTLNINAYAPASAYTEAGYCRLSLSPSRIYNLRPRTDPVRQHQWLQLIMAHEMAHCLDRSRDLPLGTAVKLRGQASLSPNTTPVKDIADFIIAEHRAETVRWREAFADLYALGYMQLNFPSQAPALTAALKAYRLERQRAEPQHATGCWIEAMSNVPSPSSNTDLVQWADEARSNADCG